MSTELSPNILGRFDTLLDRDPAAQTALDRFYDATGKLEGIDRELFAELDAAWCDVFDCIRSAFWVDGWNCGRDPARLVFVPVPTYEPTPIAVSAAAAVDAWLVAGGDA